MDLMDLLKQAGGAKSLGNLASGLGLDSSKTNDLVSALAPALARSVQKKTQADGGMSALKRALEGGNHQRYLENPELMASTETRNDGNNILGHLFGSKDVSRNVAAQAAQSTGIDIGMIKKALPMIATLAMGALSKSSNGGKSLDSALPGLLGSLAGGGSDDDGFGLDDVLGLAKKFF
jgi:hypothetical protein